MSCLQLQKKVIEHVNYLINIKCEKLLDQWCSRITFLNSSSQIQCSLAQKSDLPDVLNRTFTAGQAEAEEVIVTYPEGQHV